jgi:hypothetical protein
VDQSLDQAGAGVSTLISGDNPTPPPGFTQGVDACYSWNNTNDGAPFNSFNAETSNIKAGTHFFANTQKPGYTPYTYPHPLVTNSPSPSPSPAPSPTPETTQCSQLRQRLAQLEARQQQLKKRHRQNPRLNRQIRRLRRQIQQQCG